MLTASLGALCRNQSGHRRHACREHGREWRRSGNRGSLDARLANTLCIVNSELVSYATATLTGTGRYSLSNLYRGLYGTAIASHSSGAPFALLNSAAIFKFDLPSQYVGRQICIKLQSFNVFGGGLQNLAGCTAYTFTPTGVAIDHPVAEAVEVSSGAWDFGAVTDSPVMTDDWAPR